MTDEDDIVVKDISAEEFISYMEMLCMASPDGTAYITTESGVAIEMKVLYNPEYELTSTTPMEIH